MHADDNYGMNDSFRREMKRVFPDKEWVELPSNHPIYNCYYKFPNGLPKVHEHDNKPPQGLGLFHEDRLIAYYSYESDLGDGWEDSEVHNNPENVRAAALQNLSGQFIVPSSESGAIALNGIRLDENLAGINPNPKAKGAYPIATLTWILAYETGNGRNTEAIKDTFYTLLSDEYQSKAPALGFVPLEGEILQKSINAVGRIGR